MKGGTLHRWLLLPIAATLEDRGALVTWEYWVGHGAIDLLATWHSERIAVEAETTSIQRVYHDLEKAQTARATRLWIVTPNARLARRIRQRVRNHPARRNTMAVCVLPLGLLLKEANALIPKDRMPIETLGTGTQSSALKARNRRRP